MIRALCNLFTPPSAHVMAARQLQEAERELLNAYTTRERYTVELQAAEGHIEVLKVRIRRLADHTTPDR